MFAASQPTNVGNLVGPLWVREILFNNHSVNFGVLHCGCGPYSLVQGTGVSLPRILKIPVRDYLGSILPALANFPVNRIRELAPAVWAALT